MKHALAGFSGYLLVLGLLFSLPLCAWWRTAMASDIQSHVVLIPLISAFLVWNGKRVGDAPGRSSPGWAAGAALLGLLCLAATLLPAFNAGSGMSENALFLRIVALVWLALAGAMHFFGWAQVRRVVFPVGFLFFMAPLPNGIINALEGASQWASAEVAALFISLTGTSMIKSGVVFQLPGIVLRVGQECSGIHSSFVLFLTSLLAGYMFLNRPGSRLLLSLAVIPLGIARNALRIFTIAMLCVHIDPAMINSTIHRRGGPYFFLLSLVPLFLLLVWLRGRERVETGPASTNNAADRKGQT